MRVVAIVQARVGSKRLPKKVLKPILGRPMIELLLLRLSKSKELNDIIVAASEEDKNKKLHLVVEALGFKCFKGSEKNVLKRFYDTAKSLNADIIVRITADCPLVDPKIVDECIHRFRELKVDYLSNINPPTYPDGLDVEVMSIASLEQANIEVNTNYDKEHVTSYIRNSGKFKQFSIMHSENLSQNRWTVDNQEDLDVVKNIFEHFNPNIHFSWQKILGLKNIRPELFLANKKSINSKQTTNSGQRLYKKAKKIIPGGGMLLSKRPEMFLPNKWPTYFSKSKGCRVWDLDGKEYIDTSLMGVGTNILGYGNPEVDEAVTKVILDGNMSTLNCPEEVFLAEKLLSIHKWADMTRFARSGGEANAIAVRIARAATGRDKIAICGYHGWHDWYLSTNLNNDKNLDGHLLPGLQPSGVPRGLTGTTLPFKYNDINQLEEIISKNIGEIAAIKMEVSRNEGPKNNYLKKVRRLATDNNIILIFDECTSGFRETFGGIHLKYEIEPDMATFGKALGNGYAITSIIGRKEIMTEAESTFISSTFWTERIGPSAALKTLEVMEKIKSWKLISKIGDTIKSRWISLAKKYSLDIKTWGIPALSGFSFNSPKSIHYKTLITQEMLKKGYLSSNNIYVSTAHTEEVLNSYFKELDLIFAVIKDCEEGLDVNKILQSPLCHTGFKRLN